MALHPRQIPIASILLSIVLFACTGAHGQEDADHFVFNYIVNDDESPDWVVLSTESGESVNLPESIRKDIEDETDMDVFAKSSLRIQVSLDLDREYAYLYPYMLNYEFARWSSSDEPGVMSGYKVKFVPITSWYRDGRTLGCVGEIKGVVYQRAKPKYFSIPIVLEGKLPSWDTLKANGENLTTLAGKVAFGEINWEGPLEIVD